MAVEEWDWDFSDDVRHSPIFTLQIRLTSIGFGGRSGLKFACWSSRKSSTHHQSLTSSLTNRRNLATRLRTQWVSSHGATALVLTLTVEHLKRHLPPRQVQRGHGVYSTIHH